MDTKTTLDSFIKNFILKDKRERSEFELKNDKKRARFTNRLNHEWDTILDMRYVFRIPPVEDDYEFVKKQLRISDNESCYVISNYDDIDGQTIEFEKAFNQVYGRGLGSIIATRSGDKIYLETELEQGKQNRFFGKLN